jgi:hypothetical protein
VRRERGFGTEQIVLAIVAVGALVALIWALSAFIESVDRKAYDRGQSEERAKWQARESKELTQANAEIARLQSAYVALSKQQSAEVAAAQQAHQNKLKEVRDAKDLFIADVRAGRVVLRDPGRAASCQGSGDAGAQPAAAVAGSNAASGGQLSVEASEFLLGLAGEADEVAAQLALAQRELAAMFKACSGP